MRFFVYRLIPDTRRGQLFGLQIPGRMEGDSYPDDKIATPVGGEALPWLLYIGHCLAPSPLFVASRGSPHQKALVQ